MTSNMLFRKDHKDDRIGELVTVLVKEFISTALHSLAVISSNEILADSTHRLFSVVYT